MVPKLVAEDIPLLHSLLNDVFPGVSYISPEMTQLRSELKKVCDEMQLVYGENLESGAQWVEKVCILFIISLECGFDYFSSLKLLFNRFYKFIKYLAFIMG